ncbi:MAG: hypothetical protein ACREE0_03845 [Phenylobacterium sp.]
MRSDLTLGVWLAGAVMLHLVAASYAPRLGVGEMGQFYGVILAYAVPAGLGLWLAGWLTPWRAAGFAALVVAAHAVAVVAAISTTPTMGLSAAMMMRSGALAGVLGAGLCLFGLVGLRGGATLGAFANAAAFSLGLAVCGLLLVPALDAPQLPKELALPLILYLPWQIVFSVAVAVIARPSRSDVRLSPEPARS